MAARLLALGALVLVTAACGAETVQREASSPAAYQTARFVTVVSTPEGDTGGELRSTGIVDFGRGRAELRDESGFHEITIGLVSYGRLPADVIAPHGKRWGRVDGAATEKIYLKKIDEPGIKVVGLYLGSAPGSPAGYLEYLRELCRSEPLRVGTEEVRGIVTVHYSAQIDNRRFWRRELAGAGWHEASIERYLEFMPDGEERIEAWIDGNGYARRVVSFEEIWDSLDGGEPVELEPTATTTEFFDFGVAVDIEAPPESEVIDWDKLPSRQE